MHQPAPRPPLRLAPGLRVVRRGRDRLQVGLHPGRRVVLARTSAVEELLDDLAEGRPLDLLRPEAERALGRLRTSGCVLPARDTPDLRVEVAGALPGTGAEALLRAAGLRPVAADPDVALVLSDGELPRDRLDLLVRRATSHLVVRLVDGGAVLGPFVAPGRTACLRCVDAHESVADPEHAAVTERYARAGPNGAPDPALATLALGWAVRDLVAYAAGGVPSTWSRTWWLGPDPGEITQQQWLRHPHCGCAWAEDARPYGTMGA